MFHPWPKHFKYEGVTTWEHSSYDCFINALKAQSEGLKIHSEPFVELFGMPLMFNHTINDADLVRSFFNTDKEMILQTVDLELYPRLALWPWESSSATFDIDPISYCIRRVRGS